MIFVSEPPVSGTPDKEVFLYAEFQQSFDGRLDAPWNRKYIGASNQLVVSTSDSDKETVLTLPAGNGTPSYGIYKLFGCTAASPSKMWTVSDTIHVTVSFEFCPADSED